MRIKVRFIGGDPKDPGRGGVDEEDQRLESPFQSVLMIT